MQFGRFSIIIQVILLTLLFIIAGCGSSDQDDPDLEIFRGQVVFPDKNLEKAIRAGDEYTNGDDITAEVVSKADLEDVTYVWCSENVSDLTGLEYCTNLQQLYIAGGEVKDLSPLENLTDMWRLSIKNCAIEDINPLAKLTKLRDLDLRGNNIEDIGVLSNMKNLMILVLYDNTISDISPLADLTKLQQLVLGRNRIIDISPLKNLVNVDWLDLTSNLIEDISPIGDRFGSYTFNYNPLNDESYSKVVSRFEELDFTQEMIDEYFPDR